jgi:hypothetical protein
MRPSALWGLLLGLLLSGVALALSASPFLKPFTATFSVWRGALPLGSLELKFDLGEDDTYSYHAHTQPGLLAAWFSGDELIEESHGRIAIDRVVPESYHYTETENEPDDAQVRFDWNSMRAHTSSGGVTWSQTIETGTQDRLSQQLMVRLQLAMGQTEVSYQVADGGKLKHYLFRVVGEEPIKTPHGKLNCLKVERSKESRPPDYTIWFAPKLDYLPVRIERDRGGAHYRMMLEELEGL